MNESRNIVIIGAGPAGLAAAIEAAGKGARVCVLEHGPKPLRKLLLTGNGRCNFSNTDLSTSHYHGDKELIESILCGFSCDDMLDYMNDVLGVEALEVHYRFSENGYFYPSTNRSETVRDAILQKCKELSVEIFCSCELNGIARSEDGSFLVSGKALRGNVMFPAERIIFAAGSNAHPETGSDSSVYPVLKNLGVDFRTYLPALCAVKCSPENLSGLKGLRCDGSARLCDDTVGAVYTSEPGEIQLNERSVSGIPVLQLSRFAAKGLREMHKMHLELTLRSVNNKRDVSIPEKLSLKVTGTDGFEKCQCCSGGVPATDLTKETLEYKNVPGIYFAGEMIDVDGECGGYNLHFAFATGIRAGRSAVS